VKKELGEETSTAAAVANDGDDGASEAGRLTGYQRILGILATKQVNWCTSILQLDGCVISTFKLI